MRQTFLAGLAMLALAAPAYAQSTTVTTAPPAATSTTVTVAPAQRTKIKSYVTEHHVKPVKVKERLVVGATLPADVELDAVPSDWGPEFGRYRYVYSGSDVVLVDPGTRRVVQVID